MAKVSIDLLQNFSYVYQKEFSTMQYHKIVFMFLTTLYALCFRVVYLGFEKCLGHFESWKDIADFENILYYLGNLGHKTAVLGLDDFCLCQECLFSFKGTRAASEVTML